MEKFRDLAAGLLCVAVLANLLVADYYLLGLYQTLGAK